ncbi:hypothetical protein QYR09_08075 [Cellulophaga lytica]|nr:hypothetical protein QYR09_08075 [Cellulophaga lytica]
MKNVLSILLVGLLAISCGVKKSSKTQLEFENGWYFVTESKSESKIVRNNFGVDFITVEPNPIIKASEYSKIGIAKPNWGGKEMTIIELVYDGIAKEKWANATERMSKTNEKVVFIYNDKFISTASAFRRMDNGYASVSNENFNEKMLTEIITDLKKQK